MTRSTSETKFSSSELANFILGKGDDYFGLHSAFKADQLSEYFENQDIVDIILNERSRGPILPFVKIFEIPESGLIPPLPRANTIILSNILPYIKNPLILLRRTFSSVPVSGYIVVEFKIGHASTPQDYTTNKLLSDIEAAWGNGSYRVRFLKEYDKAELESHSVVLVAQKILPTPKYDSFPVRNIEKMSDFSKYNHKTEIKIIRPLELTLADRLTLEDIRSICVLKLDHIGDFAMAIRSLQQLRILFPKAKITCICGPWNKHLAESLRIFDSIILLDFFKLSEKNAASNEQHRTLKAQELGERLNHHFFDLAIDLRVPDESRYLLDAVKANIRAGIGNNRKWPSLDIALPPLEAFNTVRTFPTSARINIPSTAFRIGQRSIRNADSVLAFPTSPDGHFIFGPYIDLGRGLYRARIKIAFLNESHQSVKLAVDVSAYTITIISQEILLKGSSNQIELEFELHVDLKETEFRVSLVEPPAQSDLAFVFSGVELALISGEPMRRKMELAQIHVAEQMELLIALVRSRLNRDLDRKTLRNKLGIQALSTKDKSIILAPFSNSELRDWPPEYFGELIEHLVTETKAKIILAGSAEQAADLRGIIPHGTPSSRIEIAAGLDWTKTYNLMFGAMLVVTNNSGLAHIGAAIGARVLSVYSNSHQVTEWGPIGPSSIVLQADTACGPCGYDTLRECLHNRKCMQLVTPSIVFAQIRQIVPSIFN